MSRRQIAIIVLVLIAISAIWFLRPKPSITPAANGESTQAAPAFELPSALTNESFSLAQFQGKVRVLSFWATWCGPCRMELPSLIRLQQELGPQGLQVLGMNVDENQNDVRNFASQIHFNFPILVANAKIADDYGGVSSIPTLVVIDRKGQVVEMAEGVVEEESLRQLVVKLLAEK